MMLWMQCPDYDVVKLESTPSLAGLLNLRCQIEIENTEAGCLCQPMTGLQHHSGEVFVATSKLMQEALSTYSPPE